jgi:hypothetical protein
MTDNEMDLIHGSGNVFRDLGQGNRLNLRVTSAQKSESLAIL